MQTLHTTIILAQVTTVIGHTRAQGIRMVLVRSHTLMDITPLPAR